MPSYLNLGAWVGAGSMVDTWATVASCAQIGERVHLAGGVGIGGVLEPHNAVPVVVEDDAFVRKVTADVLESAGYRLLIARNAAEALAAYRRRPEPVDLLLSDVVMPGMIGPELAIELQSFCPGARLLLMSGYAEQIVRCDLSRPKQCLAKPFSTAMLLKRVREVLDTNPCDFEALASLH